MLNQLLQAGQATCLIIYIWLVMSEFFKKNLRFDIILNEAIVVENFHSNFGMANNKIFKNFGNSRKVIKLVPTPVRHQGNNNNKRAQHLTREGEGTSQSVGDASLPTQRPREERGHKELILYINSLSLCVRLSDTTILHFNSPAESA